MLVLLLALAAATPWIAYVGGLANVDGRPEPPTTGPLAEAELEFLHLRFRKAGAFVVPQLSPFDYADGLLNDPDRLSGAGIRAAEAVAGNYARSHLRIRHPFCTRVSEAALTVWLTRNWSSNQVVSRAFEIEHARRSEG